jgi:hypothetical protein
MSRTLPLVLALCVLVSSACDGSADAVRKARGHVARGDLDRAEAALVQASGDEADRLRKDIADAREHRVVVEERVAFVLSRASKTTAGSVRTELKSLRDREQDPGTRQMLEQTLSDLTDLIAAAPRAQSLDRGFIDTAEFTPVAAAAADPSARERLVAELRADVRTATGAREWARALELAGTLADQPGIDQAEVRELRAAIVTEGRVEISRLRAEAYDVEEREGPYVALEVLEREAHRFPRAGDLSHFHQEVLDLRNITAAQLVHEEHDEDTFIPLEEIVIPGVALASDDEPERLAALSREREETGDLVGARTLLLAAAQREWPGDQRDEWVGQARDLKGRLALRSELVDARRADPERFAELDLLDADERGWTTASGALSWEDMPLGRLQRVAALANLSPVAVRGLMCERLRFGDSAEVARTLSALARLVEDGDLDVKDATGMVSRWSASSGERRDYLLIDGEWKLASMVAARRRSAAQSALERALMEATGSGRDAALDDLAGASGTEVAGAVLRVRMDRSLKVVRAGRVIEQLSRIAEQRVKLDAARAHALELIFDAETYFYPYNPPTPPKTAGDYSRAQRAVDQAVSEVDAIWKRARSVRLSASFLEAVEQLRWGAAALDELKQETELPPDVPAWLLVIPSGAEDYGLHEFARDAREAMAHDRNRRVRQRNEKQWVASERGVPGLGRDAIPNEAEREQVRVTNDYRLMMGRSALAWNPRLQVAAQGHSNYMANTGDFGHTETNPERRTVLDRLSLVDYLGGGSENCHQGGGDPKGAHDGWVHSSGHHRNILTPGHREMGSGLAGFYWTQNFGSDDAFMEDLDG